MIKQIETEIGVFTLEEEGEAYALYLNNDFIRYFADNFHSYENYQNALRYIETHLKESDLK